MAFRAENEHVIYNYAGITPSDRSFETENGLLLPVLPLTNRVLKFTVLGLGTPNINDLYQVLSQFVTQHKD